MTNATDTETDEANELKAIQNTHYSLDMIDTMFADSLSRGMQNAITSQQNAQMVSSSSVTNACARILQARSTGETSAQPDEPTEPDTPAPSQEPSHKPSMFFKLGVLLKRYKKALLTLFTVALIAWVTYEVITRLDIDSSINVSFTGKNVSEATATSSTTNDTDSVSASPKGETTQ